MFIESKDYNWRYYGGPIVIHLGIKYLLEYLFLFYDAEFYYIRTHANITWVNPI